MVKRILIRSVIVLVLLVLAVYITYDYWLGRKLEYQLSEIVNKNPNILYNYSFRKLNINLLDGSVTLKGIKIEPKDHAYDSLISIRSKTRFLLRIELEEMELANFEIMEFIKTRNIYIKKIILEQPSFLYSFHPTKPKTAQGLPLNELFSDKFRSARIDKIFIIDGKLQIDNYESAEPAFSINKLDVTLTNAYADSLTLKHLVPIDYKEITLFAESITLDVSSNFSMVSDSLVFNALNKSFQIYNFQINPKYNQENFANNFKVQKQWFALKLGTVSLRQINIERFLSTGEVHVDKIRIRQPNIALFKDKTKPEPEFKKKLLPASAIKTIPINLSVDSVQVINGYLSLNERHPKSGSDSHISFYNLNGLVTNFTNINEGRRLGKPMSLNATGLMYNQVPLQLNMEFDLESEIDRFTARGNVGEVDISTFNPVLQPIMGIRATNGKLHQMTFEFNATDTLSTGFMDMEYNDIKLDVLRSDSSTNKKGIKSLFANTIIKSNNLLSRPGYKHGIINTTRVQNKDVWAYLWHSLQSGIVSTMVPISNTRDTKRTQRRIYNEAKEEKRD